jgi:hypothetical protein
MQDINLVQSLLRLYQSLLLDSKAGLASNPLLYLESTFIFACIWSLGGAVDTAGREHFSTHFRSFLAGVCLLAPVGVLPNTLCRLALQVLLLGRLALRL